MSARFAEYRRLARGAAVVLLCVTAFAISSRAARPGFATQGSREVTDEAGRTVKIPQPVRRIVSLAPSMTETVYALGLQDRLVGDTDYCDYPADAAKKHKVGGAINPNIEEIAALKPDLVLVVKSLNRLETVRALEQIGIAVYSTDPHTVQDVIGSVKRLAGMLGAEEVGNVLSEDLTGRLAAVHKKLNGTTIRRVLFVVWTDPLMSIGRKTFIADVLERAGGTSVVDSGQDWPQYSLEEAVRLQPEYLVFASNHSEKVHNEVEALALKPGWSALNAIKNRKIAVISDAINRPGPRIVDAVEELARQLHPEVFAEKN
ncbi:MAG: cobalamin-binding protein [Acidobacteria bacterium]|nr:cobalamin-binding protein [Acidobacteriota bacterium]MBS1867025.1 cobalamin-binding protein [Acidobacteriota bacterium]